MTIDIAGTLPNGIVVNDMLANCARVVLAIVVTALVATGCGDDNIQRETSQRSQSASTSQQLQQSLGTAQIIVCNIASILVEMHEKKNDEATDIQSKSANQIVSPYCDSAYRCVSGRILLAAFIAEIRRLFPEDADDLLNTRCDSSNRGLYSLLRQVVDPCHNEFSWSPYTHNLSKKFPRDNSSVDAVGMVTCGNYQEDIVDNETSNEDKDDTWWLFYAQRCASNESNPNPESILSVPFGSKVLSVPYYSAVDFFELLGDDAEQCQTSPFAYTHFPLVVLEP